MKNKNRRARFFEEKHACFICKTNKKASLETKEILELILGAAGIFILIFLLWSILAPGFNHDKEAAKSYMNTLKSVISEADSGKVAVFSFWSDEKLYLVYFGTLNQVENFAIRGNYQNYICVCYEDKDVKKCESCFSLSHQSVLVNDKIETKPWTFEGKEKLNITLVSGEYKLNVIK